ncbi:Rz1-like lysis system protein LysC [Serratia proteamaculans]|uniref:Rz1-like lysis system protein LysC n=1 Tax=Serratia proteamaculans TaxID=28151 RepID=UPI00217963FC|nr:hypothetical protein [Serratia proteamaculans]CAI0926254.1 Uncharacterised protein [Serratia proteamaculans]
MNRLMGGIVAVLLVIFIALAWLAFHFHGNAVEAAEQVKQQEKTLQPAPQQVVLLPPESVFIPCEQPTLQGDTWGDAMSYALTLQTSLQICSGQVAILNQWRDGIEGTNH